MEERGQGQGQGWMPELRAGRPAVRGAGRTAVPGWKALLWLVVAALPLPCQGQAPLQSPQDIQVDVVNTNFTLRWSHPGGEPGVTFSAEYKWSEGTGTGWQELPGCQNVPGPECDFSSAVSEYYDTHWVRVRAQRGEQVSPWSRVLEMVPDHEAKIGPPGMELQPTNGDIKIKISPPEANQGKKMWLNDLSFKYNLVFWENSSNSQPRSKNIFPVDTVGDLAPDTTYCFKVQANLPTEGKEGLFSPVRCVRTTQKVNDLLCATNLRVLGLNMEFHLHWDNQYKQPVSYNVQYLIGYLKRLNEDYSGKWVAVPGCGNVTGTRCNVSSAITTTGFYYLRVQARGGHNRSCLSTEVKVDPLRTNEIGPPGLKVDISDTLLHIQISPPGGPEGEVMRNNYVLSYRILYWRNSSSDEEEAKVKETKQTVATIPDLAPETLYCVKAQAFSEAYNKSSVYSQEECIQTPGATFMAALFAVLLVALPLVFVLYKAYSKIKYVFFPSCQPPLNIEGFGGQLCTSPYLPAPEEPVENYSVIDSMITYEGNQIDCKDYKHSNQSSRDSGNYSNDDNTSGSKGSAETLGKEIV
ncbi:interferon alpha/beta receptor 1 isoform X2 [Pseudopipra pipra]|uniref:interferon alpha/beta receptor 1 isoform X2 n=1 Tax=Pseudopipra pipra TaxID=415032 RepID=UPI003138B69D